MERAVNLKDIKTSAQLSTYGLHVIISSCELMTKPRCCLDDSEISEFMSFESNSAAGRAMERSINLKNVKTSAHPLLMGCM